MKYKCKACKEVSKINYFSKNILVYRKISCNKCSCEILILYDFKISFQVLSIVIIPYFLTYLILDKLGWLAFEVLEYLIYALFLLLVDFLAVLLTIQKRNAQ